MLAAAPCCARRLRALLPPLSAGAWSSLPLGGGGRLRESHSHWRRPRQQLHLSVEEGIALRSSSSLPLSLVVSSCSPKTGLQSALSLAPFWVQGREPQHAAPAEGLGEKGRRNYRTRINWMRVRFRARVSYFYKKSLKPRNHSKVLTRFRLSRWALRLQPRVSLLKGLCAALRGTRREMRALRCWQIRMGASAQGETWSEVEFGEAETKNLCSDPKCCLASKAFVRGCGRVSPADLQAIQEALLHRIRLQTRPQEVQVPNTWLQTQVRKLSPNLHLGCAGLTGTVGF